MAKNKANGWGDKTQLVVLQEKLYEKYICMKQVLLKVPSTKAGADPGFFVLQSKFSLENIREVDDFCPPLIS